MHKELEACGVSDKEYTAALECLREKLSLDVLPNEKNISVSTVLAVLGKSGIVNCMSDKKGFAKVKKSIVQSRDPKTSLYEPHGEWFQLMVGYLFFLIGEDVSFEGLVNDAVGNKDIIIRNGNVIIECKSFAIGDGQRKEVLARINGSIRKEIDPSLPPEFNRGIGFFPAPPMMQGDRDSYGVLWMYCNDYMRFC